MDMKDSKMVGELRRPAIKKEHVSERLPSLRGKRDLTLGGVPKRTYSPVIPVRKARPDPPATSPNSITNDGTKPHKKKKDDREKTPKRPRKSRDKDVLTSASVFSMGPAEQLIKFGKNASHGGRDSGKVAYNKQRPFQAMKQEAMDTTMSSALPDDEGEGLDGSCDFSFSQYPPVQLPLDPTRHVKQPLPVNKSTKPSAAVKPIQSRETSHVPTAADLFTNPGDKAHMLFLQLPDCLPVSGIQQAPMETDQPNNNKSDNPKQTNPSGSCELSQLPTGYLGKIQVHKSGRVKLSLGANSLDVTMGTPCDFQQDLVSIHTDNDGDVKPHLVTLGQLSHRLICLPDLDQLLTDNNS